MQTRLLKGLTRSHRGPAPLSETRFRAAGRRFGGPILRLQGNDSIDWRNYRQEARKFNFRFFNELGEDLGGRGLDKGKPGGRSGSGERVRT